VQQAVAHGPAEEERRYAMNVGAYLKKCRLEKGLTMRDVVTLAGDNIDKTVISRVERGERGVTLKAAFYFSEIYGIDLKEIAKMDLGKKAKVKRIPIVKLKRGRKKGSTNKPKK